MSEHVPTIAFCSTARERLHHVKETVPRNMEAIADSEGVCQVLLDYNCPDGLEDWVRSNAMQWIESGKLHYFKERTMPRFKMSHSKNLAHKCAETDIVCNLDIDNWIHRDYPAWLRANLVNHTLFSKARKRDAGIQGNIAFWKRSFLELGGYDEAAPYDGHTMEDISLIKRGLEFGYGMFQMPRRFEFGIDHKRIRSMEKRIKITKKLLVQTLEQGILVVNEGKPWGTGRVTHNFDREMDIE